MYTYKIKIEDMMCKNCAKRIEDALDALEGTSARCNLSKKEVIVDTDAHAEDIYEAIKEAGYTVTNMELV